MLEELTIKDFALIENDHLEFGRGFTVFSGETGAGKSILIGALSFLLGGRADVQQIRAGASEASVSAVFSVEGGSSVDSGSQESPESAAEWLMARGISTENGRILIRRFIRPNGKSGAWIGDVQVTRTELAAFSSFLVDIHGQHEHQSLMKVSEHRKFLDARAGLTARVSEFTALYAELAAKRARLDEFAGSEQERGRKLEMMRFAAAEIEEAGLKPGEDETLAAEETKLLSYEKIYSAVDEINGMLSSGDSGVVQMMKRIRRGSSGAFSLDPELSALDSRVEAAFYEISDIADEFSSYMQELVFDPARLQAVQERLSLIFNLKKKYASSVSAPLSEVTDYLSSARRFIEENSAAGGARAAMEKEVADLGRKVLSEAKILSDARRAAASSLSSEVEAILSKLGMDGTRFGVSIRDKSASDDVVQKCGPYGTDDIEFMISANPGAPMLPLAKIASGGELSRVMLALKTIFAMGDTVGTLIFDEIDTGIGGGVAVAVGEHLKFLARTKQVFCITHLASIAVYADNQIKVEKAVSGGITSSNVHQVTGDERVAEIARMLSGDADTEQSLEHARTMLRKFSGGN